MFPRKQLPSIEAKIPLGAGHEAAEDSSLVA
jgi:hypothetical protein